MSSVVIVVLNWNGWKDTIECLESLDCLSNKSFSVVVVDNASSDNSREQLLEWGNHNKKLRLVGVVEEQAIDSYEQDLHPMEWVYVQSSYNGGFAAGNNMGIRLALNAGCDYVWLLNNDTVVDSDALVALQRRMDEDSSIGMCGSLLYYYHDKTIVQAIGGVRYDFWQGRGEQLGQGLIAGDPKIYGIAETAPTYVAGASLFLSSGFLHEIGLMEESYFLYYEEIDWAVRASGKWKIATAVESIVYHKEGGSIGTASLKKRSSLSQYYLSRNLIRFYMMRKPFLLPVAFFGVLRELLARFWHGDRELARVTGSALLDALMLKSGPRR